MKKVSLCAFFGLVFIAGSADARKLDQDEIGPVSQIASALNAGLVCNYLADDAAMGRFLASKVGERRLYDNESIAQAMFFVIGIQAMQAQILNIGQMNKLQLAKFCRDQLLSFGPNGTAVPGLLKP